MQSQLEAALLGHGGSYNQKLVADSREDLDEAVEECEDSVDEEYEDEISQQKPHYSHVSISRTVTLQMLLAANILQAGKGTMCIEYLGQKFIGDLLPDGKIQSQETDLVFASPSAWAIACKRFINPVKKSGCGWASIKYRGRKLDVYKNIWYRKKQDEISNSLREEPVGDLITRINKHQKMAATQFAPRMVVKHNTIANRTFTHDANTLVECVPFSNLGKIQPFLVSISTNAALLMDFHCHLTHSEVSGYLAGHWDVNGHNLQITNAFPCRNTRSDRELAPQVEAEIARTIDRMKLILVGWYHSHPFTAATPTLRDVDAQLDYQIKMKGLNDTSYTPCIGIIVSPYNYENNSLESSILAYWVIPPPENKPNEYGRPMLMSYSVVQDSTLTPYIKDEVSKCVEYYKKEQDFIKFTEKYTSNASFIEKLKSTLLSKFPLDQGDGSLWPFIRDSVGCSVDEESLLTIPMVSKNQILPPLNTPASLSNNLMLSSDIANVLFNSGKFPSTSSLLGLPDPLAHSTLAANNMFLQTNMFKMQDLLKPVTNKSVTVSKPKTEHKSVPLKIPTDIKKMDFQSELGLLSLKNKFDFTAAGDYGMSEMVEHSKNYLADPVKPDIRDYMDFTKKAHDFSMTELNVPTVAATTAPDYSLNLSMRETDSEKSTGLDLSQQSNS